MIDSNRLAAVEGLLEAFLSKPSESRIAVFAKRTEEYPIQVLKRACVRLVENSDRDAHCGAAS